MDICGFEWTSIEFSGCWWIFMNRVDMCHGPVTWFLETHQQKMPSPPWKYPWNKESCSRQWDDHTPSTTLYVTPMKPLNPWRPWFDLGSNPTPNIEHHLNCPNGMWKSRTEPWFLRACFILGGRDLWNLCIFGTIFGTSLTSEVDDLIPEVVPWRLVVWGLPTTKLFLNIEGYVWNLHLHDICQITLTITNDK